MLMDFGTGRCSILGVISYFPLILSAQIRHFTNKGKGQPDTNRAGCVDAWVRRRLTRIEIQFTFPGRGVLLQDDKLISRILSKKA